MSNQYLHEFIRTNERSKVEVHLELAIGASGAVTINRGIGIFTAAKTATGEITITLHKFNRFIGANFCLLKSAAENATFQVKSVSPSTGQIVIMTKVAGVAADLASGDVLYVELKYKNTVVAN